MLRQRVRFLARASAALALCVALAGCAVAPAIGPVLLPNGLTPQAASAAVQPGKSSKADVLAALGPATRIRFDTGYEVWVYRNHTERADPRTSPEFVILFAPSGIVKKTRIRPAYPAHG